ncbi:MAG: MBL fold metallo-hydrolase [Patescibacteria group bacterium]
MVDWFFDLLEKHKRKTVPLFIALIVLDAILFSQIIAGAKSNSKTEFDFLNVGQGDSELVQFASETSWARTKLLIDGGPENGRVLTALASLLPSSDRYIDLVAMTHAQADHIGGLIDVAKRYRIGTFIWTGRTNDISAFRELMEILKKNNTKIITLMRGDVITSGESVVRVLSPDKILLNDKDINNSSLVLHVSSARTTALFTGDIGRTAELRLVRDGLINIDILKVPHHGSRSSVIADFLNAVKPKIVVFGVGKNSYGHPSEEALINYAKLGASIFRTDKNGTLRFIVGEGRSVEVVKNFSAR